MAGAGHLAGLQGDYVSGRASLEGSLVIARELGDEQVLATALYYSSQVFWQSGDYATARNTADEGVLASRRAGHRALEAMCNYVLGAVDYELGDLAPSRVRHEESLRLYRDAGYVRGIATALQQLGRVTYREGGLVKARLLMEESLVNFREAAWPYGVGWSLITLGWIATDQGQLEHARKCLSDSMRLLREIGARSKMVECLEGFAQLEVADGRPERALRLAGAAAALRLAIRVPLSPGERGALEPRIQRAQAVLGRASAAAWAAGQALSLDEAVAYALAALPTTKGAAPVLTRREREVADLVGRGLTSRQIAEELVVTERTVETHLERMYAKLGIHSRAQLATWFAVQDKQFRASPAPIVG
jgi:DNA-binding CsgD family transcriptional regulator